MALTDLISDAVDNNRRIFDKPVYEVGEEYVAKQYYHLGKAQSEMAMLNRGQQLGINVPNSVGVFSLDERFYFVMERILGVHIPEMTRDQLISAVDQLEAQIKILLDGGINPLGACWPYNSIYVEGNGKLVLIDSGDWRELLDDPLELFGKQYYQQLRTLLARHGW